MNKRDELIEKYAKELIATGATVDAALLTNIIIGFRSINLQC
mgnify:CR=1 FL=1|jgi:hypothetical protein